MTGDKEEADINTWWQVVASKETNTELMKHEQHSRYGTKRQEQSLECWDQGCGTGRYTVFRASEPTWDQRMFTARKPKTPSTGKDLWVQGTKRKIGWRGREQEWRPCTDNQDLVLWSKWDTERAIGGDCEQWDKILPSTRWITSAQGLAFWEWGGGVNTQTTIKL